jgi:hypothetical protein
MSVIPAFRRRRKPVSATMRSRANRLAVSDRHAAGLAYEMTEGAQKKAPLELGGSEAGQRSALRAGGQESKRASHLNTIGALLFRRRKKAPRRET